MFDLATNLNLGTIFDCHLGFGYERVIILMICLHLHIVIFYNMVSFLSIAILGSHS